MKYLFDDDECHCYDPRNLTKRLYLCGSELCKAITNKAYRDGKIGGKTVIVEEDEYDPK